MLPHLCLISNAECIFVQMFLLLVYFQTRSAALSSGKCCGADVMVYSLGKVLLVKIKQVMW